MNSSLFEELYKEDYELDRLFAMRQYWQSGSFNKMEFSPRPTSALLYLDNCSARYISHGSVISAEKRSVLCLPCGSTYRTELYSAESAPCTLLVEFNAHAKDGELLVSGELPFKVTQDINSKYRSMFMRMIDSFQRAVKSPAVMKSNVYSLLASLGEEQRRQSLVNSEYKAIAEGIAYLEKHLDQRLSIAEISEMCYVSPSSFRRNFKRLMGVSPVDYRNALRTEHAKRMLENSTLTVEEIADALGIDDISYFYRSFKKSTGMTPGEYREKVL